ncbi:MAG: CHAP domain-containing protein [Anaerolineales bacterium]|nr:CHAP domain-containing protein [Anaerolineales bacterium]
MADLRIDTERVTAVSQQMNRVAATAEADVLRLSEAVNKLEQNWSGDNSFAFVVDIRGTLSQLNEAIQSLEILGGRLHREAQKWEFMDQRGAAKLKGAGQVDLTAPSATTSTVPQPEAHSIKSTIESERVEPAVELQEDVPSAEDAVSTEDTVSTDWKEADVQDGEVVAKTAVSPDPTPEQQQKWEMLSQSGSFEDGAGPLHEQFPEGECTWYASSRRNFGWDVHGHAYKWADQAQAAGYDVGNIPAQGAVMVWQPGVHKANMEYGHVSIVERVEKAFDGSFVVFFTDNNNMNPGAPSRVTINPDDPGVRFIYGKTT